MSNTKIVVSLKTGKSEIKELTVNDIAQKDIDHQKHLESVSNNEARQGLKTSILARLKITKEELKDLLSD